MTMLKGFGEKRALPHREREKVANLRMRERIAQQAARLIAEDGLQDYALAKIKAARQIGAPDTRNLPNDEEVARALRDYQALYQKDEQSERLHQLRQQALAAMLRDQSDQESEDEGSGEEHCPNGAFVCPNGNPWPQCGHVPER